MMHRFWSPRWVWAWVTISACALQTRVSAATPPTFFIATNGNDHWSGGQASPNSSKTDGPFATLSRALEATRQAVRSNRHPRILLRSGVYQLDHPLVITPEDSGLSIAAYRKEKPVLSGGRRIVGWREENVDGRMLWVAPVPQAPQTNWVFRQLWINGTRAIRARHPNRGYLNVAELLDKSAQWTEGNTRFRFHTNDLKAWKTVTNAELVVMTKWVESRLPVASMDEPARIVQFGKRSVFELAPDDPYYLEGCLEVLDQPGEWFLDPKQGKVFYMPRPGEQINQIEAIAPALPQVLRFEGKPSAGRFVSGISLRGLTFSHTEWYYPNASASGENKLEVGGFSQAAVGVPGAVWAEGLTEAEFEGCNFRYLGNYGLELARGCISNRVVQCEFSDLGGGGLKIGETSVPDSAAGLTRANEIRACHIHDGGKMFQSAIGIWIGQSPGNQLVQNLLHDFYYTGISIGWTWGYGASAASNNLVALNHIHHIGIKSDGDGPVLSDMGGIYTLGKQPGTRVLNNLWHDMAATRYGGWGIYFDEGSSGILAESNLVYRTTHGGFHQHYGETNIVRNNIFAFGRDQQLQRSRVEPHRSFSFETNIVYFNSGTLLGSQWEDDQFRMDYNVYFDSRSASGKKGCSFGKATLEQWQGRGHDQHSIISDPLFVAPEQGNFAIKPGSPALKLGFRPIDLTRVPAARDRESIRP